MSVKPYTNLDEESNPMVASEPAMQEMIQHRCVNLSDIMGHCKTLEESRRILEDRVYKFYHPEV